MYLQEFSIQNLTNSTSLYIFINPILSNNLRKDTDLMNIRYMKLAITLAKKGLGFVNPNPCVGAVIVKNDRIIGQGYHHRYGALHAERDAFMNLTESSEDAQMYITLEPCCHYGKQPPCTEAIIEHGIKTVYIGSADPNELVAGKGIELLRRHGITVVEDVLKEECDALNPVFFHYITNHTPYVAMKYAMTLDGKIATVTGASQWITCNEARTHAHMLRHQYSGIMAGIQTVLQDDPMLNCRLSGLTTPARIICDSHLRIPLSSKLVRTARESPVYVAHIPPQEKEHLQEFSQKKLMLSEAGVHLIETPPLKGHVNLPYLLEILGKEKIDCLLLEGGGTLNESFLKEHLVNHIYAYIAPKIFGGTGSFTPVGGKGITHPDDAYCFSHTNTTLLGTDILLEYDPQPERN